MISLLRTKKGSSSPPRISLAKAKGPAENTFKIKYGMTENMYFKSFLTLLVTNYHTFMLINYITFFF